MWEHNKWTEYMFKKYWKFVAVIAIGYLVIRGLVY
jgi:hypothetical protein